MTSKEKKIIEEVREYVYASWALGKKHGIGHWDRVYENGQKLLTPDVNPLVVGLFAYLHDSCRYTDGVDINHGRRAAAYVELLRDTFLKDVSDEEIGLLQKACFLHTSEHKTGDPTIDACFDADRLDLWRVGIVPDPDRLATEKGKEIARATDYKKLIITPSFTFGDKYKISGSATNYAIRIDQFDTRHKYLRSPWQGVEWKLGKKRITTDTMFFAIPIEMFSPLNLIARSAFQTERTEVTTLFVAHLLAYEKSDVVTENIILGRLEAERGAFAFGEVALKAANIIYADFFSESLFSRSDDLINAIERYESEIGKECEPKLYSKRLIRILNGKQQIDNALEVTIDE